MSVLIEKCDVKIADINKRIAEAHLYEIATFIGDDWRALIPKLELPDEVETADLALKRWWTDRGDDANYRSLVDASLGVKKIRCAEKVIELVKCTSASVIHVSNDYCIKA